MAPDAALYLDEGTAWQVREVSFPSARGIKAVFSFQGGTSQQFPEPDKSVF